MAGNAVYGFLDGHDGPVAALYADGSSGFIVSASWDHTSKLWDLEKQCCALTFSGHTGAVRDCKFSDDGRIVFTAGDTTVRLWDRRSAGQVGVLRGHHNHVTCIDIAKKVIGGQVDSLLVLSGSYDNSALVWDLRLAIPVRTLVAHTAPVTSCCFTPDYSNAITAGMDNVCRIFDISGCYSEPPFTMVNPPGRSKHLRMLKCASSVITKCRLSPDGSFLATASQDGILGITKLGPDTTRHMAVGRGAAVRDCAWDARGCGLLAATAADSLFVLRDGAGPAAHVQAVLDGAGRHSSRWGRSGSALRGCCLAGGGGGGGGDGLALAGADDGSIALWSLAALTD